MMVKFLHKQNTVWMLICCLLISASSEAQVLTEIVGKRLYEHHSPGARNANGGPSGEKSGYDFVAHDFVSSFNPANFGRYTNGEEQNIDMVEHNGPASGTGKAFGITSGTSSIWAGDIRGNSTTSWVVASSSFDYTNATSATELRDEYNAGVPDSSIESMTEGAVYIARIRNTGMFVAMKCYNVTNGNMGSDIYFDFDYKYGTVSTVSLDEENVEDHITMYPMPASDVLTIANSNTEPVTASISALDGRLLSTFTVQKNTNHPVDISNLAQGTYLVTIQARGGRVFTRRIIKH
ncbi:T9SS type A sorting domain-containing protein [Phaeocystidibacter marisrubri]|uniref:T9SS type A sorting domain-containing protein n=1 Tax=Phaeocystidibacter marisrubri TaxID=1577780 RepID=A0A6L3ZGY4_9FLAO|nr:T9SS type A sorting domain-containing protein [Phaeocystidibacter marisrubri]KAB2816594.1 T9SS type A sorting domain-containing protein [Phaeocystidibacter marisrubri]GGH69838.1 hypothetical protein GCM10011318_11280 [Phaeocystidibacter marisrubri]